MTKDEEIQFLQDILKERVSAFLNKRFPVRPRALYYPFDDETYDITEIYITKPKEIEESDPHRLFLEEIIYMTKHPIEDSDVVFYCANTLKTRGKIRKYSFTLDEVLLIHD